MTNSEIDELVQLMVQEHNTNDPVQIINNLGIILLYEPLGTINGYYNKYNDIQFIHINQDRDLQHQKWIASHELGHYCLHPNTNIMNITPEDKETIESQADYFAEGMMNYGK